MTTRLSAKPDALPPRWLMSPSGNARKQKAIAAKGTENRQLSSHIAWRQRFSRAGLFSQPGADFISRISSRSWGVVKSAACRLRVSVELSDPPSVRAVVNWRCRTRW
jgi:hypothetical protein